MAKKESDARWNADTFLGRLSTGIGAMIADRSGNVLDSAGDIDAFTIGAVCGMTADVIEDIGPALGIGNVRAWALAGERGTVYVRADGARYAVAIGPATRSPEVAIKSLTRAEPPASEPPAPPPLPRRSGTR